MDQTVPAARLAAVPTPRAGAKIIGLIPLPGDLRKKNGTGLGLSIVQKIIKDHGGDISLFSEEGKGTTFTLRVPRGGPHEPSAAAGV